MINILDLINSIWFEFSNKPILIGWLAMEYYWLRKSGWDIDLLISKVDFDNLMSYLTTKWLTYNYWLNSPTFKDHPEYVLLEGCEWIMIGNYEIWKNLKEYTYECFTDWAVEHNWLLIVSIENLLFIKNLRPEHPKYIHDLPLIIDFINTN